MKIKQFKTMIREVVREEIRLGLKEIIGELKQPTISEPQQKKIAEKKQYTNNNILNDVLNETAANDEWKTLGGSVLDSSKMNDVVGQNYGDLMNGNTTQPVVNPNDPMSQFVNKDYRKVLEKTKEISDRKHGR